MGSTRFLSFEGFRWNFWLKRRNSNKAPVNPASNLWLQTRFFCPWWPEKSHWPEVESDMTLLEPDPECVWRVIWVGWHVDDLIFWQKKRCVRFACTTGNLGLIPQPQVGRWQGWILVPWAEHGVNLANLRDSTSKKLWISCLSGGFM